MQRKNIIKKPLVRSERIKYSINGKVVEERHIRRKEQRRGKILSGYLLKKHNVVEIEVPYSTLIRGENNISFEIPRFPKKDHYIYIYQLEVEIN